MLKIIPLRIFLPEMSTNRRDFDEIKHMSLLIKDDEIYDEIREKVRNSIKKQFDSESAHNEKHLRTKIKSYKEKTNKNFHNNKIAQEDSPWVFLSLILTDSIYREDKKYYSQVFLEEYRHIVKEKSILLINRNSF